MVSSYSVVWAYLDDEIIQAAKDGDLVEVERLPEAGIDVNYHCDKHDGTALIWAAINGHTEIVEILLNFGADGNKQMTFGFTALMDAAENGHTEVVELLIDEGAKVNLKDNKGRTALMLASQEGHTEIVELLKNAGAVE